MKRTEVLGTIDGTDLSIGIVVAQFNEFITSRLLEGALEAVDLVRSSGGFHSPRHPQPEDGVATVGQRLDRGGLGLGSR